MKIKFIVKPPLKKEYQREFLKFKKEFSGEIEEEFTEKEGEKSIKNLAKKAIEEGFETIVFVGGDGTLNEGINGIMEKGFPENFKIGTIPTGSGNNFAKELKILNIEQAFEIIKKGKEISIDIGKVNERYFINCVSFGFDGLVNKLANQIKDKYPFLPRKLSYLLAALKEIIIKIPEFEIKIEGDIEYEGKIITLATTNSQSYGGIFKINPGAKIDDGKFNVCLIEPVGKIRALIDIYKVIKGKHLNLPEVKTFLASFLEISSPNLLFYETDGEVPPPERKYKISLIKKAIKFLVP